MDTFASDIRLIKAVGNENFVALGTDKSETPYEGEIIYKDNERVICRCWNWREAVRIMLTENTKNAFLCIELVDEKRYMEFENALKELAKTVENNLGGTTQISILDINNKKISID